MNRLKVFNQLETLSLSIHVLIAILLCAEFPPYSATLKIISFLFIAPTSIIMLLVVVRTELMKWCRYKRTVVVVSVSPSPHHHDDEVAYRELT
jgi:hypothetical protein